MTARDAYAALGYIAAGLILLGVTAIAWAILAGREQPRPLVRARWAWRCRGKPVKKDGEKLTREEIQALGNLDSGRDVRSRT